MSEKLCPVNQTLSALREAIESGRLSNPRSRRIAEELLDLLTDVAWGRAGADHLGAIASLADELSYDKASAGAMAAAKAVWDALGEHREVFQSHIDTHNCATGDCVRLVPAPCQMTCPAGIDIPTYVNLVGLGHDAEAIEVIRRDNPFPWVCGLVCTRPCEFMCVRGRVDKPISIKFLKAFAAERALSDRRYRNPAKEPDKGKRVAVVGAGPGGMTAAYYLALKGYGVTVFEALPVAGGMMMLGIPRYRLPAMPAVFLVAAHGWVALRARPRAAVGRGHRLAAAVTALVLALSAGPSLVTWATRPWPPPWFAGAGVEGEAEGKPGWLEIAVGPRLDYRFFSRVVPYVELTGRWLTARFRMSETLGDLSGEEKRKVGGDFAVGAAVGADGEVSRRILVKGKIGILPFAGGVDTVATVGVLYRF